MPNVVIEFPKHLYKKLRGMAHARNMSVADYLRMRLAEDAKKED